MPIESADTHDTCIALAAKVEFLKQPDAYPEKPQRVETVETHMSWVFLTDRYAYKLKKPVRYEFLDLSNVEARRHDCEEEVRLNRRLAPGLVFSVLEAPFLVPAQRDIELLAHPFAKGSTGLQSK